ncbi:MULTISPECIES: YSC84-related protein [Halocynthiibacter]|uniref:YSC84-related protein n=1 Tax=Halocynthiibacter halioticoli TaxID=2986804 RepID=A0AAE3LUJ3_9RHOB|nr:MULTISPECIES: YSC84-related protein [Halocynthiibacter]MCV6824385.1 YSC84-related protein [Halocynthiibacter halioticoli]MCW4057386.1 YSC84-related protein [Halocynthiibacter sp. SDUM655004]
MSTDNFNTFSRRGFLVSVGAAAALGTTACSNGLGSTGAQDIDARVDATLNFLYSTYPGTTDLRDKSAGMLIMPVVTKAGFGVGGSYGRGALRINNVTVDYYSATEATVGFQIGAQQYAHVLFFMTEQALMDFRHSSGWAAGADLEYALNDKGGNLNVATTTATAPVIAAIFGQAGFLAGASLEGTKYSRIIP